MDINETWLMDAANKTSYLYVYIYVCDFICRFLFDDSGGDLHRPMDFLLDILDKMGDGAQPICFQEI